MFSRKTFQDLCEKKISREILENIKPEDINIATFLTEQFKKLYRGGFEDEYIYKYLLIKDFIPQARVLIPEFRIEGFRADLLKIDDYSCQIYEIKSENDNLSKIKNQINRYLQICPLVNVVCSEKHIKKVLDETPDHVGVFALDKKFFYLYKVRASKPYYDLLCAKAIYDCLRVSEIMYILAYNHIQIPRVSNGPRYKVLLEQFSIMGGRRAHYEMCRALLEYRQINPKYVYICDVLWPHLLRKNLPKRKFDNLTKVLSTDVCKEKNDTKI